MKKLTIYAVLTAALAFVVTLVTWQMNGWPSHAGQPLTYVSFICWASYFLIGANVKAAIKAFCSIAVGVVAAVLMLLLCVAFGFDPWWAVPLAVAILVIPMTMMERVKFADNVAAIFLGTGTYFSLAAAKALTGYTAEQFVLVGLAELLYVFVGFAAGWITIQFNTWASKMK